MFMVPMKAKKARQPKQTKPAVQLKDLKPKKDAKGGRALNYISPRYPGA
jgi:hypothetical protein